MTLGKQLVEVANGDRTILETVQEKIRNHREVKLLMFCFSAAKNGKKEINIGKCLPPRMDEEGIFFRKNENETMTAYWA